MPGPTTTGLEGTGGCACLGKAVGGGIADALPLGPARDAGVRVADLQHTAEHGQEADALDAWLGSGSLVSGKGK